MRLSKLRFGVVGVACAMVVGMGASPVWGQCVPPPSGLVSWWDGDAVSATTAFDIQGTNDGSLVNGVVTSPGQVGSAFSFDGVNQFIDVGNPPSLDPAGQSQLTVDAWVFPAAAQNNFATIIDKRDQTVGNGGTQWIMQFQLAGNKRRPEFAVATDAAAAFAQASLDLTPDVWHHLAGVYDGTTVRLYVDGALAASQLMGGGGGPIKTFPAPSPTISIGAFDIKPTGIKSFFTGLIDEVEIYNRALSAPEILAIFNAGSAGKCKCPCDLFTTTAFEPPMGKKKKIASTLPIKFRLFFDGVEIVSEAQLNQILADNGCTPGCPKLLVFLEDGVIGLPLDDVDDNVGDPDEGDCFRYSAPNWIYNLRLLPSAGFMPQSCFSVEIEIGDCVLVPDNNFFETK